MGRPARILDPDRSVQARYGAELRRWRLARRLTLRDLAGRVWLSQESLAKIEKAERWPSEHLTIRCDEVLGTDGVLADLWPQVEQLRVRLDGRRRPRRPPSEDPQSSE